MNRSDFESLGFGVGLRRCHYAQILDEHPPTDWFEVISENFMVAGGRPLQVLEGVRSHYPIVMHGVSLSIGSTDPLNFEYLKQLSTIIRRFEPAWVSDHLCWTGVGGRNSHDLLPLPYTDEAVRHVANRFGQVPTLIEWDNNIPEFEVLGATADEARSRCKAVLRLKDSRTAGPL